MLQLEGTIGRYFKVVQILDSLDWKGKAVVKVKAKQSQTRPEEMQRGNRGQGQRQAPEI